MIAYSEHNLKQSRQTEIRAAALRSVTFAGSEVQRIFDGIENLLLAIANSPFVDARDEATCRAYIERLMPKVPHLRSLGVADTQGMAWCGLGAGLAIADRSYFKDALATPNRLFLGNYSVGRASGAQVMPFGLRPAGSDAVAYGSLDLKWLAEKLLERGLPNGGSITLADRDGRIIARQPYPERFIGTQIPDPFMHLVRADKPGTEQVLSQDGTARVLGYLPVNFPPAGLYLSVGLSYDASYGASERLTQIAALIAFAGACFALMAAWVVGDRMVVKPLSAIAATTSRWRAGDSSARTTLSDTSEYGVVADNLNRMMDELQHNERQREILSRELEHRVKNMLTTVQAIAGMSFGQSTSQADLQTFLNRLKALGEGYSALRTDQWKAAALSDVVARAMAPLGGTANGRLVIEGPPVHLDSSQVLAVSMVLHELGTNAVKYGALSNGHGKISIVWSRENGAVRLTWTETDGPAVTPPSTTGFGTRLIQAFGKELGDSELHYDSTGLRCTILISATPAPDV